MSQHENSSEAEDGEFVCNFCDAKYPNSWELLIHQEMHTEENITLAFKCGECDARFALERQLNRHVLSHSEELKPFKCQECSARFRLEEHLDVHLRKHNVNRPYVCEKCGFRYEQKTHLMSHMKSHTDERPYVCDVCNSAFKRSYDMKVHRSTHTEEKPFHCDICGSDFKKLAYLTKHKKTHTTDRFTCEQCGAMFKEKRALVGHVRLHNRDKSKSFVCHICEENFPTTKLLQVHVRQHTKLAGPPLPRNEEKIYHCYQCGCSFSTNNPFQLHKSLQHDGETPYQCSLCTAAFTQEMYLAVHVVKHVNKKIFCDRCKTYCNSEYEMGVHEWQHVVDQREAIAAMEQNGQNSNIAQEPLEDTSASSLSVQEDNSGNLNDVTSSSALAISNLPKELTISSVTIRNESQKNVEMKRFNCDICMCSFNLPKPLELHKQLQHEGETPFECHWCSAAFTEERFMTVHIYKHLEKKSTCVRCKIVCNSEYELGIHDCQEEIEELRYHCNNCSCSFSASNPYTLHQKLQHEGVAPYSCQWCKATFTQEKFLNVHIYKHVGKELTCGRCNTVCNSEYEMGIHEWHHVVLDKQNTTVQPSHETSLEALPICQSKQDENDAPSEQELSITLVYSETEAEKSPTLIPPETLIRVSPNVPGPSRRSERTTGKLKSYIEPPTFESLIQNYQNELEITAKRKKYHCENCGCSFSFPKPYELHVSLQHDGETNFECQWCSAKFTKEQFRNVHVYKHLEKQIKCRICRVVCNSEYEMGLHEWEHELGEESGSNKDNHVEAGPRLKLVSRKIFCTSTYENKQKRRGRPRKNLNTNLELISSMMTKSKGRPRKSIETQQDLYDELAQTEEQLEEFYNPIVEISEQTTELYNNEVQMQEPVLNTTPGVIPKRKRGRPRKRTLDDYEYQHTTNWPVADTNMVEVPVDSQNEEITPDPVEVIPMEMVKPVLEDEIDAEKSPTLIPPETLTHVSPETDSSFKIPKRRGRPRKNTVLNGPIKPVVSSVSPRRSNRAGRGSSDSVEAIVPETLDVPNQEIDIKPCVVKLERIDNYGLNQVSDAISDSVKVESKSPEPYSISSEQFILPNF